MEPNEFEKRAYDLGMKQLEFEGMAEAIKDKIKQYKEQCVLSARTKKPLNALNRRITQMMANIDNYDNFGDSPTDRKAKRKISFQEMTFLDKLTEMSAKVRNFQETFDARKPYYNKESNSKKKLRIMEEQRKVAHMKLVI